MSIPSHAASTQFTENMLATSPSPCERCKVVINPGEPRLYIAPQGRPDLPGKYVCKKCFDYYCSKPSTTLARGTQSHTTTGNASTLPAPTPLPNPMQTIAYSSKGAPTEVRVESVRRLVNQSQRQGAHSPLGRVTAIPLPSVHAASVYQRSGASHSAPSLLLNTTEHVLPSSGYSIDHLQYAQERHKWSNMAYKGAKPRNDVSSRPKEEVRVIFQVWYEVLGDKPIKTALKEGKAVSHSISSANLIVLARETMLRPLTRLVPNFPWDLSATVLRESKFWHDVSNEDASLPYFAERFLKDKPGSKSGSTSTSKVFVAPKTPIEFALLIDRSQWLASEDFLENGTSTSIAGSHGLRARTGTESSKAWSLSSNSNQSSAKRKTPPSPQKSIQSKSPMPKRVHTTPATTSPERSTSKVVVESFTPLDPESVRKGVLLGVESAILEQKRLFDSKITERVSCYSIDPISFNDLCNGKPIIDRNEHLAYLSYYPEAGFLGKGTFKTAHSATLRWISSSPSQGLTPTNGSSLQVALKRPYDDRHTRGALKRFNCEDEGRKVHTEATNLGWASSLLKFSYHFIDDFVNRHPHPPFDIPRFRFVEGAIAYAEKPIEAGSSKAPVTSHRAVYLLEELIPTDTPFLKYIHNGEAVPLQDAWEPGYETGVFLCFIQHVQFAQTHGQAYVSDFQGAGNLLTDPQIMSHPDLAQSADGKVNMFGEGNVDTAFYDFTKQHKCNEYCTYFELEEFAD
ncbi:hypothetical protein D9613_011571 [Agrocybe pediades]|uniref:Alpha-type protein kinase domain-containing protein n=1 Tax=Agrocybe pediades TaxID=84607 RepID=A0A8H4QWS8_9AGAR|nr:hypothetical protein D9613_011571 [Agrocybe pediades]